MFLNSLFYLSIYLSIYPYVHLSIYVPVCICINLIIASDKCALTAFSRANLHSWLKLLMNHNILSIDLHDMCKKKTGTIRTSLQVSISSLNAPSIWGPPVFARLAIVFIHHWGPGNMNYDSQTSTFKYFNTFSSRGLPWNVKLSGISQSKIVTFSSSVRKGLMRYSKVVFNTFVTRGLLWWAKLSGVSQLKIV